MKIDSVHILFWSYSGTTEAFAAHMAADIRARGWEPRLCNLLKDKPDTVSFSQRDLLIMLCPVFAGRTVSVPGCRLLCPVGCQGVVRSAGKAYRRRDDAV